MNKNLKGAKGITLIALVITIIVLIILAGISIGLVIRNNGIMKKDAKGSENYTGETIKEQSDFNKKDYIKENTKELTLISKEKSYVGYYADIDADGTVDGIIFADLAVGTTKSGEWSDSNGVYSIPTEEGLKDYYVKKTGYVDSFGTSDVIAPISGRGKDRFYIMALKDIRKDGKYYDWYNSAYGQMSDYASTTSIDFGKGKSNTLTMIGKWNSEAYGAKDNCSSHKDMWGQIQEKVNNGWFVPSRAEWAAFAGELEISKDSSNPKYYGNLGLSNYYWSSSQINALYAWIAYFYDGSMCVSNVNNFHYVRLAATF